MCLRPYIIISVVLPQVDTVGELLLSLNKQQFGIDRSRSQDLILAANLNVARVPVWLDRKLRAKMHVSRIRCSCPLSSTKVRQQYLFAAKPFMMREEFRASTPVPLFPDANGVGNPEKLLQTVHHPGNPSPVYADVHKRLPRSGSEDANPLCDVSHTRVKSAEYDTAAPVFHAMENG